MMTFDISEIYAFDQDWREKSQRLGGDLKAAVSSALKAGKERAQAAVPKRTGDLARTITGQRTSSNQYGAEGEIASDSPYVLPVLDGARPHEIRAKGKALRFESGGATVFTKRVSHPGNKPNDFATPAAAAAENVLNFVSEVAVNALTG